MCRFRRRFGRRRSKSSDRKQPCPRIRGREAGRSGPPRKGKARAHGRTGTRARAHSRIGAERAETEREEKERELFDRQRVLIFEGGVTSSRLGGVEFCFRLQILISLLSSSSSSPKLSFSLRTGRGSPRRAKRARAVDSICVHIELILELAKSSIGKREQSEREREARDCSESTALWC